ncbi:MAG: hypothetical protein HYY31_01145 [Chloroflexi bacterium]|nr:hypothetical protein [Chloroflexota bacterium]
MPRKPASFEEALAGAKRMSEKYTQRGPFKFYPDPEVVQIVQEGLARNELEFGYRYCP